jgi:hypothetical protein
MVPPVVELEQRVDDIIIRLLSPLRAFKSLDKSAFHDLLEVADSLEMHFWASETVPRKLTGKLWYIYSSTVIEARHSHARSPEPIHHAADQYLGKWKGSSVQTSVLTAEAYGMSSDRQASK